MSCVQDGNYIVIQSFMVKDLHLKGNELLIYAIIYGFTQDGEHQFNGGLQYLMAWTNSTKAGVYKAIKRLIEKGLIEKIEQCINGVNFVNYRITLFTKGVNFVYSEGVNFVNPYNITSNNKDISSIGDRYNRFLDEWNSLPSPIPHIQSINGGRKAYLNKRVEEYGEEKISEAIKNIEHSSFLQGQNDRGWVINFDWFIKPNNFVKVLEGNYNDKPKPGKLKSKPTYDLEEIKKKTIFDDNYDI